MSLFLYFVLLRFCYVSFCFVKSLRDSVGDVALFGQLSSGPVKSRGFTSVGEKKIMSQFFVSICKKIVQRVGVFVMNYRVNRNM